MNSKIDPLDELRRCRRPWLSAKDGGVPWSIRKFAFNLKTGMVDLLPEGYLHLLQPDGETVKVKIVPNSLKKHEWQIQITADEVEAIFRDCEKDDSPLKVGFARTRGQGRLTEDQISMLAVARDRWVYAPMGVAAEVEKDNAAEIAAFKASVFGTDAKTSKKQLQSAGL